MSNSWHFVGQSEYVNTYRGLYWVGETKTICSVDKNLNFEGNISSINYNVTVWEVDVDNDLELTNLLATSEAVSGSEVEAGGSWVSFSFENPVLITSGKTVIPVSRVDKDNYSIENMLRISNNYDEDQPKPFPFDVKLYGEKTTIDASTEYPAAPLNPSAVAVSGAQIDLS